MGWTSQETGNWQAVTSRTTTNMDSGRGRAIIEGLLVGSALGRPANGLRRGHLQQALGGPLTGFLANPRFFPTALNGTCFPVFMA